LLLLPLLYRLAYSREEKVRPVAPTALAGIQ